MLPFAIFLFSSHFPYSDAFFPVLSLLPPHLLHPSFFLPVPTASGLPASLLLLLAAYLFLRQVQRRSADRELLIYPTDHAIANLKQTKEAYTSLGKPLILAALAIFLALLQCAFQQFFALCKVQWLKLNTIMYYVHGVTAILMKGTSTHIFMV